MNGLMNVPLTVPAILKRAEALSLDKGLCISLPTFRPAPRSTEEETVDLGMMTCRMISLRGPSRSG